MLSEMMKFYALRLKQYVKWAPHSPMFAMIGGFTIGLGFSMYAGSVNVVGLVFIVLGWFMHFASFLEVQSIRSAAENVLRKTADEYNQLAEILERVQRGEKVDFEVHRIN